MMMRRVALVALSLGAMGPASAEGLLSAKANEKGRLNPIRKVVTLLQAMQKKVQEEGEAEKELYDKFMCYCKTGTGDLESSVAAAESKSPSVGAEITASEEKLSQSKADLKAAQEDRTSAKAAITEATALREKEAAAFASTDSELQTNIAAINKAVAALEKGMTGFLQTHTASIIKKLISSSKVNLEEADRQTLLSFLGQTTDAGYAPSSGEVTGILKELADEMGKDLADVTNTEQEAIKSFEALVAAKKKEIAALSETVEAKTGQIGDLGVAIVTLKEDLSDTEAGLLEDQKFLAELEKSCSTKTKEWDERTKTRADELVALAETIKVLNDDDALDLFKKTLSPAESLMQLAVSSSKQRAKALADIRDLRRRSDAKSRPSLDFIALALSGSQGSSKGFDKVLKMIDEMVQMLGQEQVDDDHKKDYCGAQLDSSDDKKKAMQRSIEDIETAIEAAKEGLTTTTEELEKLEAGIKALDKSVAEATEQRKAENVEYKELMASDSSAKQLLEFAKNRLNKYYNPKLYKPPAKQELSREDQIFVNNGGTPPPTEAPGGIAGTGITALVQISQHDFASQKKSAAAPPPPPSTWGAYQAKGQETNGVTAMIDLLIKDLEKEMTEAETEEKESQSDYEAMMTDAAEKRAQDSSSLTEKTSAKADLEAAIESKKEAHTGATKEHMAVEKYISSLHAECDWLLNYFDVRKSARSEEVDALKRAKAVLNGADYSLVQTSKSFLSRRA